MKLLTKIFVVVIFAYEIYKGHFQKSAITSFDYVLGLGSVGIALIISRADRISNSDKGNYDYPPEEANLRIKRILLWLLVFAVFLICFFLVIERMGKA